MGLGPAEEPRLNAVSMAPRLCHMSAGGPRRFSIGDAEFARAVSPYELECLGPSGKGWVGQRTGEEIRGYLPKWYFEWENDAKPWKRLRFIGGPPL